MSADLPLGDPKPARGGAKRERRRRRRDAQDAAYREYILALPCLVCGGKAEGHHERGLGKGDRFMVPVCLVHHRGPQGRHGLQSLTRFEETYGLNLADEIARLNRQYQE